MNQAGRQPIGIVDHDPRWAERFAAIGTGLRDRLGGTAARIDHIGSTAVAGLEAKDVIDVQVTVAHLAPAQDWPDEIVPGLFRRPEVSADHVPPGVPSDADQWTKLYWSDGASIHVHVREEGRLNQRYALLVRDYLRVDRLAAGAYGLLKRALAEAAGHDVDTYYAVKDPACDLILAGAEQWALRRGWTPGPSDA